MRDLRGSGRLRRTVIGVVIGTALVSGCAEKQEASDTLPTSSAAATTDALPALGPADLPMPSKARERTPEGAKAFVEYYVKVYNHARSALDSTYMRELSRGCDTCDQLASGVDSTAIEKSSYVGGEIRIDAISTPAVEGDVAQAAFLLSQTASKTVTGNGEPVAGRSYPETKGSSAGAVLSWDANRSTWLLTQLDVS